MNGFANDYRPVSVETLDGGAFADRINEAIQECLCNIQDISRDDKKARQVKAVIKLVPDGLDGKKIHVVTSVESKLAQTRPSNIVIYSAIKDGELVAYEQNIEQPELFQSSSLHIVKSDNGDIDGGEEGNDI